jgi:peptide/nickel transport system substrate-binding protein
MKTKNLSKLVLSTLALFMIVSMLLLGCAPASNSAPAGMNPAIVKGGNLKIIYNTSPDVLGYLGAGGKLEDMIAALPCVETLLKVNENGALIPGLATSWKGDLGAKTITLTLRKGVKFQDGTDFNAKAVKWNLDQGIANKKGELKLVTSVDVIDDYTVRVNFSQYDSQFPYSMTIYAGLVLSPTYFETHGGVEGMRANPVGTGPFKFVSFKRDVNLKYEKFNNYWQEGKPYLDGVEFIYIADSLVRLASLRAGEGDVLLDVEPQDADSLKNSGDYTFSTAVGRLLLLCGDSAHSNSPFTDIKVRQAIEYAIDRDTVVKAIGRGYWQSTDQLCGKNTWGYNPTPSAYSYNPKKAKELLAEAGFPKGLNVPLAAQTVKPYVDFYTAILTQLNEAGFNLTMDGIGSGTSSEYVLKTGWNNRLFGDRIQDDANCLRAVNMLSATGGAVFRSIKYPQEVDDLVIQARSSADFEFQKKKVQEANALNRDKYSTFTVLANTSYIGVRRSNIHDDGCYSTVAYQANLQDAWIKK